MSDPMICESSNSVISSPESVSGRTHSDAQDGPMIDRFGPDHVLANLSARQAKEMDLLTSGTYGQHGNGLSSSANLQRSLANRLQAKTQSLGSSLFRLTWKEWVLPSGRSLSRLRASVLRTSATERISWPTPTTPSGGQKNPEGTTETGRRPNGTKATVTLGNVYMARIGAPLPPAFARVLMHIPASWDDCAPTATRSTTKRRRNSSK